MSRRRLVALAAGQALACALSLATSLAVAQVLDLFSAGDAAAPALAALALALALASAAAGLFLGHWLPEREGLVIGNHAARDAAGQMLACAQRAWGRHDKGYYVNVLTGSAPMRGTLAVARGATVPGCLACLALVLAVALALDPILAAVLALYVPVLWAALRLPAARLASLQREGVATQDAFLGESKRIVEDRRAIAAARAEGFFSRRYHERAGRYLAFVRSYRFNEMLLAQAPQILSGVLSVVLMGIAATRALAGDATFGLVFVAYQLASIVQAPVASLFQATARLDGNRVHEERLEELARAAREPSGFEPLYR